MYAGPFFNIMKERVNITLIYNLPVISSFKITLVYTLAVIICVYEHDIFTHKFVHIACSHSLHTTLNKLGRV